MIRKHIFQRGLFVFIVITLFVLFGLFFIDVNQRSCLGNPQMLPLLFIGLPLITVTLIIDVIYLAIFKKLNWIKFFANLGIILAAYLVLLALFQSIHY